MTYIPVVEIVPDKKVKVVGFASFLLEEIGGNGNESYIKATYAPGNIVPAAGPSKSGEDFGLYTGKLLG